MQRVRVRIRRRQEEYEIMIGGGALAGVGKLARRSLSPHARRIVIISNKKVFDLYGARARQSLRAADFDVAHWLMNDGERYKTAATLEGALSFLSEVGLERVDALVALGGGVVGDLAGFAAAVYLRGIAFLQIPTTLLAQVDASVGGKVAVNTRAGKNLIGAFHHPRAVLIDPDTLESLPPRELTAGWCESVKQGAAGSGRLFNQTHSFLAHRAGEKAVAHRSHLERLIAAQVAFKARIVAGDEREDATRDDYLSRRILNFGHTTAHALEAATHYRRFRHGEAVGYGMLVAGEISKGLGLLAASELESLRDAVRLCGQLPRADDIREDEILSRLAHDKKRIGGQLKWVLLERVGRVRIVDGREIGQRLLRASLRAGLQNISSKRKSEGED
ncbi:MAG: 3-dehydroquinate synthase [Acidobacteriota bacterium]|jgi:3-dehydroquinate synthase|nr:3-dehydroquinate synthase [Acidobacteriota bacterium]